jgi:hypothetical protein
MNDKTRGIDLNSTIADLITKFVDEIILSAEYLEERPAAEGSVARPAQSESNGLDMGTTEKWQNHRT